MLRFEIAVKRIVQLVNIKSASRVHFTQNKCFQEKCAELVTENLNFCVRKTCFNVYYI
jgi:hypothetical protein